MAYTVTKHIGLICNRLICCLAYILLPVIPMLFVLHISYSIPFSSPKSRECKETAVIMSDHDASISFHKILRLPWIGNSLSTTGEEELVL